MAEILKQNIGNKIIRQIQPPYKILKSNYNFGKSLHSFDGVNGLTNVQVTIPALIGMSFLNMSVEAWLTRAYNDGANTSRRNICLFIDENNNKKGVDIYQQQGYNLNLVNDGTSIIFDIDYIDGGVAPNEIAYVYAEYNEGDSITLTKAGFGRAGGRRSHPLYCDIGLFRLYNRLLSENEYLYSNNKLLGNPPINRVGLLVEYLFKQSEILDFSALQDGSDMRVGIRNYGSVVNGHGQILNLPAGTLEEQRDWANANLFVNFL